MESQNIDSTEHTITHNPVQREVDIQYQRAALKYITEIAASLRSDMDIDTLLRYIATAVCEALQFRHSALYLADASGMFRVCATHGLSEEQEHYLLEHPLGGNSVALLIDENYRMSNSYFIPAESPIWHCEELMQSFLVIEENDADLLVGREAVFAPENCWNVSDLLLVPLVGTDNTLLGFLTPDAPLHTERPTHGMMELLELFANQAAIAITNAHLYADLRIALQKAQESEKLKNHFLMAASHELRTPLTAIQGYLELLCNFDASLEAAVRKRFMVSARRSCDELVLLLNNVMDTSRVDQERIALNMSAVQVVPIIHTILEIMEPTITREKRVTEVHIADDLVIWADDLRLRQVFLNLGTNALKYTPMATPITMSAERVTGSHLSQRIPAYFQAHSIPPQKQFVVLAIRDRGRGITAEDQQRLFTKFTRLPDAITSKQRGSGLGLFLCRQLVEGMEGHIWIESQGVAGEGSTFLVALPEYHGD